MALPFYQVDAFTNQAFKGNPAGVVLLDQVRPDDWMLAVAREINLSETAFLLPEADGYRLRWFTPTVEVNLCGHATLSSAHILFETERLGALDTARFYTRSGLLTATREDSWIHLNFPAKPTHAIAAVPGLDDALGLAERSQSIVGHHQNGDVILVELDHPETVSSLQPDFVRLAQFPVHGVIVTARGTAPYDFVSRFFAPAIGINEDPVTGSAHCRLGCFWQAKLGGDNFMAYQASARGGELRVQVSGDRVHLFGQALTVLKGDLLY